MSYIDSEELRELLVPQFNVIRDKVKSTGTMTTQQACDMKTLLSCIEKSYTIEMAQDSTGYDNEFSGSYGPRYGYSRRTSRGANGGYVPRGMMNGGYDYDRSGHGDREAFKNQLRAMMQSAPDANTKMMMEQALSSMQ